MSFDLILKGPTARFVVVHFHVFKNGGSTIESILEREFPDKYATLHGASAEAEVLGDGLISFLERYPHIAAVSSHHLRYPVPVLPNSVLFDWCFLRNPLARLNSMYTYLRRIRTTESLCQMAVHRTVSEFLRHLIDQLPHLVSNVQVQQLANSGRFTRPASRDDLIRATKILQSMAIPGMVEIFDESLVSAEYFLQPAFPGIRLHYLQKNVSQNRRTVDGNGPDLWRELWDEDVYRDLVRLNQFDLQLCQAAEEEIRRRLTLLPRASDRLTEFRTRCVEFQQAAALRSA